jgi:hypothetical protein
MARRPAIDLASLTAEAARPMADATQRTAHVVPMAAPASPAAKAPATPGATIQALAFKVPPAFRRRFRQRAADADLKLNELLFEALDAWEEKRGLKK